MRKLLKSIYKNLLPRRLRLAFDIFPMLRTYNLPNNLLAEKKIVIIAPHPDDEIIGCGGAIHICHRRKAEITAVFMTDGRKGNDKYKEDELVIIRRREAQKAGEIIGIDKMIFLDNKDSELSLSSKTVSELLTILSDIKPEAVFIPFFLDNHIDHITTNKIFFSVIKSLRPLMCYSYGFWTILPYFNLNVDITPYIDIKRIALKEYTSQLETYDYIDAAIGLSKYYSLHPGGRRLNGWSEVFFVCRSNEYQKILIAAGW